MTDHTQVILDSIDAEQARDQSDAAYLASVATEQTHTRVSQHKDSEYTAWTDQNGASHTIQVVP
jgi:hypothetical protein